MFLGGIILGVGGVFWLEVGYGSLMRVIFCSLLVFRIVVR